MKILYQHRTQAADGGYVHIKELTDALKAQGHEVIMVGPAFPEGGSFAEGGTSLIGTLRRFIPKPVYELMELAYSVLAYRRLLKAYKEHQPDVYYERYNLFFLPGVWLRKKTGVPMLLEVNAPLYEERCSHSGGLSLKKLARWSERQAWHAADGVLPVTDVLADYVRAEGVAEEKIEVIANGVGAEFLGGNGNGNGNGNGGSIPDGAQVRQRYGIPEDALVLGFTGFVRPWHGLDRVIDLIAERSSAESNKPEVAGEGAAGTNSQRLHLLMVGDGPAREALEAQAQARGVSDRVTFTGLVKRGNIPAHVAAFDVALQPSVVAYASPLKLFEYLALGKAVVAPNTANIREVLTDGENALLFAPDDLEDFRCKIEQMASDNVQRQRLGEGGRRLIHEGGFTWARNAERVAERFARLQQNR